MKNNPKYDLHIHTTYSDGQYTPDEIIKKAEQLGLEIISITDHDTVNAYNNITTPTKIRIIPGIEMSAKCDYGTMHILGYNINTSNYKLIKKCSEIKENSIDRFNKLINELKLTYDIEFTKEELDYFMSLERRISRVDLAKKLIEKNIVSSVDEAFDKYLVSANKKVKKHVVRVEPKECIDLIHNAGGIAVLAHPSTLELSDIERYLKIKELKNLGLDGIEAYHSDCNIYKTVEYLDYAKQLDLLVSGGSDFHGESIKPDIKLGTGKNNNLKIKKLSLIDKIKTTN